MECESEFKQLYNSGFKLINLKGLDQYFRIRSKLRCTFERLLIEETDFSLANQFEVKLWEECYEKPINWIQNHLITVANTKSPVNTIHLRRLRSVLINILDEGSTFFQLLLRSDKIITNLRYKILIYCAILLRKREKISKNIRAFNLLQDAITTEPFKGFGYFILAQWSVEDGDDLLAMYWALISFNVVEKEEKALEFLKSLSRNLATSPSFASFNEDDIIVGQLFQMATHALLSHLTGTSHLKHLDQLSHSQIRNLDKVNLKSLKYSITILWIILGMFGAQDQVSQVQTCILAKLFQVHSAFITNSGITRILLAFASNDKYSRFFTGNNFEAISKINMFSYELLNNLLKKLLLVEVDTKLNEQVYLDYLVLDSFSTEIVFPSLIEYFVCKGLYHRDEDGIELISEHEKTKKTERSMKLLTHRFLSTKLESIEATIEPNHLPWTIPDYSTLLKQFQKIRKSVSSREIRVLITLPVLQELDLDKSQREIREIIRFLHERIDLNDPCVRLEHGEPGFYSGGEQNFYSFRQKLKMAHLRSIKMFVRTESSSTVKIICSDSVFKEYLMRGNIQKDLIFNEI